MKNIIFSFTLMTLLASCATDPIDPLNPAQAAKADLQPQCPVGYEPVQSTEIVLKPNDKESKTARTKKTFQCKLIN